MKDFLIDTLEHSWGKSPKQKAREKEYNHEYYLKNKDKWKTYRKGDKNLFTEGASLFVDMVNSSKRQDDYSNKYRKHLDDWSNISEYEFDHLRNNKQNANAQNEIAKAKAREWESADRYFSKGQEELDSNVERVVQYVKRVYDSTPVKGVMKLLPKDVRNAVDSLFNEVFSSFESRR